MSTKHTVYLVRPCKYLDCFPLSDVFACLYDDMDFVAALINKNLKLNLIWFKFVRNHDIPQRIGVFTADKFLCFAAINFYFTVDKFLCFKADEFLYFAAHEFLFFIEDKF